MPATVLDRESPGAVLPAAVTSACQALLICACRIEVGEAPSLSQLGYSPASLRTLHTQTHLGAGLHGGESRALQHLREFAMQVWARAARVVPLLCTQGAMLATRCAWNGGAWHRCTPCEPSGCRSTLLNTPVCECMHVCPWEGLNVGIIILCLGSHPHKEGIFLRGSLRSGPCLIQGVQHKSTHRRQAACPCWRPSSLAYAGCSFSPLAAGSARALNAMHLSRCEWRKHPGLTGSTHVCSVP